MDIAVERQIGSYKVTVSGSLQTIDQMLKTLDTAVNTISGIGMDSHEGTTAHIGTDLPPAISSTSGLSEAIIELFKGSWGTTPRRISEVRDALATNGLIFPLTTLSGRLLSLTKKGSLRRLRTPRGYQYVRGYGNKDG